MSSQILVLFEVCCHPEHSEYRATSMLQTLDSLIQSLGFLSLDASDPRVTRFGDHQVPIVPAILPASQPQALFQGEGSSRAAMMDVYRQQLSRAHQQLGQAHAHAPATQLLDGVGVGGVGANMGMNMGMGGSAGSSPTLNPAPGASSSNPTGGDVAEAGCSCTLFKISSTSPQSAKTTPFWLATPGWNSSWSLAETRYEEQRRLVWSALTLATAHVSYTNSLGEAPLDLAITKPWMVRVLPHSLV